MSILKFQMMLFAYTRLHEEAIKLEQQYPGKGGQMQTASSTGIRLTNAILKGIIRQLKDLTADCI